MSNFVPVAKVSEIPDPGKKLVEVDERLVVVIHQSGQFYAIDDVCTHDGGPLGEGELEWARPLLRSTARPLLLRLRLGDVGRRPLEPLHDLVQLLLV